MKTRTTQRSSLWAHTDKGYEHETVSLEMRAGSRGAVFPVTFEALCRAQHKASIAQSPIIAESAPAGPRFPGPARVTAAHNRITAPPGSGTSEASSQLASVSSDRSSRDPGHQAARGVPVGVDALRDVRPARAVGWRSGARGPYFACAPDNKATRGPGEADDGMTPGDSGVVRDMSAIRRNPGDANGPPGSAARVRFLLGSPRLHEPEDHADVADSLIGQRRW